MVKLLEEWTDMFPYDFRDDRMTAAVREIMQGCDCVPHVSERVGALLQTLLDRLTKLERFEHQVAAMEAESVTDDRTSLPTVILPLQVNNRSINKVLTVQNVFHKMKHFGYVYWQHSIYKSS